MINMMTFLSGEAWNVFQKFFEGSEPEIRTTLERIFARHLPVKVAVGERFEFELSCEDFKLKAGAQVKLRGKRLKVEGHFQALEICPSIPFADVEKVVEIDGAKEERRTEVRYEDSEAVLAG